MGGGVGIPLFGCFVSPAGRRLCLVARFAGRCGGVVALSDRASAVAGRDAVCRRCTSAGREAFGRCRCDGGVAHRIRSDAGRGAGPACGDPQLSRRCRRLAGVRTAPQMAPGRDCRRAFRARCARRRRLYAADDGRPARRPPHEGRRILDGGVRRAVCRARFTFLFGGGGVYAAGFQLLQSRMGASGGRCA